MISLHRFFFFAVLLSGLNSTFSCSARQTAGTLIAIYEGSTPCGDMPRSFLKIPVKDSCEFIKWQFSFYKGNGGDKSRFRMKAVYGLTQPNTLGFSKSTVSETAGEWSMQKRNSGIPAIIYQLVTIDNDSISFIALNNEMLHPLDASGRLMIGNAGWSYTLSRTDNGQRK